METNNNEFKFITAEEVKRISDNNDKNLLILNDCRQRINSNIKEAAQEGKTNIVFYIPEAYKEYLNDHRGIIIKLTQELLDAGYDAIYISYVIYISWQEAIK